MSDKGNEAQSLLDLTQAAMSKLEKVALTSTNTITAYDLDAPKNSTISLVKVTCVIDRPNKMAHLMVQENYSHANQVTQIYYLNDTKYVSAGDGWQASPITSGQHDSLMGSKGGMDLAGLSALQSREFSLGPATRDNVATLVGAISAQDFAKLAASTQGAKDAGQMQSAEISIDINRHTYVLESFRVSGKGQAGKLASTQTLEVVVQPLAANAAIQIPATLAAHLAAGGMQNLKLASATEAANCWCTGCAACAACLACLACVSCVACLFPPLLAPVTAAAAGTAIAAAVGVSTSASVGIATAIQKGG